MTKTISIKDINEASNRINGIINKTPILTSSFIDNLSGSNLFFKCENFQKVGAFKFRGASNVLSLLNKESIKKGVATHSSGNHAQALALAAKNYGVPAYIVMPQNAPKVKVNAVMAYKAKITFCEANLKAREETLKEIIQETNATFVHPYNDFDIIAGQGTASLELLKEVPDLDIIISPIGGGGLCSGTLIYSKEHKPSLKVYGAEPSGASDAKKSLALGELQPSINPKTICDGLLTSLGDKTFSIISHYIDDILLVDDNEIISAMKLIWERMKIIVEPSSATVLAVVLKYPEHFQSKKIGLILSGGNVDLNNLPWSQC